MPWKSSLPLLVVLLGALPPAHADPMAAIERARVQDCGAPRHADLHDNAQLRQAAQRMADGFSLHAALAASGYLAAQSSAVHISGAERDLDVERMLATAYCRTLTDPRWQEIGAVRRGRDMYMVLARAITLPSEHDSARIRGQILDLVNAARSAARRCGGKTFAAAAPLVPNAALAGAAQAYSEEMAATGRFDHIGRDGSSPAARARRAGYGGFTIVGENIAAGAMTPGEVVQGWLDSPPHCENLMDPRFSQVGIGFAVNRSSSELVYWTQDFAAPRPRRARPQ